MLTLQAKMIILVVLLVIFVGIVAALKIQTARLAVAQKDLITTIEQRDIAIAVHDQVVGDLLWQKKVFHNASVMNARKDEENERLHAKLRNIMATTAKQWADTPIPTDLLIGLPINKGVPTVPGASTSDVSVSNSRTTNGRGD